MDINKHPEVTMGTQHEQIYKIHFLFDGKPHFVVYFKKKSCMVNLKKVLQDPYLISLIVVTPLSFKREHIESNLSLCFPEDTEKLPCEFKLQVHLYQYSIQ
jgi:hypothetical protein